MNGRNGGSAVEDSRPRLGMRIVGPSAEELDQRDANPEEFKRWTTVLSIAKSMSRDDPWDAVVEMKTKARPFRGKPRKRSRLAKGDVLAPPSSPQNEQDHDPTIGVDIREGTLEPPYPFTVLCELFENSGALRRNIDAMVTNIDSFGHRFEPVIDFSHPEVNNVVRDLMIREAVGDKKTSEITPEDIKAAMPTPEAVEEKKLFWEQLSKIEKGRIDSAFEFINPVDTFSEIREATRELTELLGNGGWEVMREDPQDVNSPIQQVYFVPFTHMRLMRQDKKPTRVKTKVRKDAITFETMEADRLFRRFVRLHGRTRVFYKEFGDPRIVSRETGRVYAEGEKGIEELIAQEAQGLLDAAGKQVIPPLANEFYHWKIRSPRSPYGVPRWIGELIAVLGTRSSEEVNLAYFENKSIPPMVLLVSGGRVSESDVERIESYIEDQIRGKKNFHKIMVLEALPAGAEETSGDIEHSGKMRIELKPLLKDLPQDALFQQYDKNNQDKIGRSFRQPPLFTGDTTDMNRACYSDDTETLTESGWKLVDDIGPEERVAAYSPKTGKLDFVVPTAKLVYRVEGEDLYHFKNQHTDCLVTWDHRMLVRYHGSSGEAGKRWRSDVAEEVVRMHSFAFRTAIDPGEWNGEIPVKDIVVRDDGAYFRLPKVCSYERKDGHSHSGDDLVPLDLWLEFLGYWISEGSLLQTKSVQSPYLVTLCQKKPKIRKKIQKCLDRLPWGYSKHTAKSDGTTRWRFHNRCLREWLRSNCGDPKSGSTKSGAKKIPHSYTRLPIEHLTILFEAMMDGDGHRARRKPRKSEGESKRPWRGSKQYFTKSDVLADQVQQVAVQLGMRCIKGWHARVWRLTMVDAVDTRLISSRHVSRVKYAGRVYCFSVPTHGFFVTRRNGKIAIQGNTSETAKAVVEEQVYQPARDKFDGVMNRFFLPNHDIRFWRFRTNAPVQRFPNDLVDNVVKSLRAGGITPNEARQLLSDAFSIDLPHRAEDWAQIPPRLAEVAARQGELVSADPLADNGFAEGESEDVEGEGVEVEQSAGLMSVIRGFTTVDDGHRHEFIVLGKRFVSLPVPGGDGHTHGGELTAQDLMPGAQVKIELTKAQDHGHMAEFSVPLSKRHRQALKMARSLHALRQALIEVASDAYVRGESDEF